MSLRSFVDFLYGASRARTQAATRFPGEAIFLCSGATILPTKTMKPIGKSPLRYLQVRGNAVFTNRRIFLKAAFWTPFTLLFLPMILYVCVRTFQNFQPRLLLALFAGGILIFQRRPFERDIPIDLVREVHLSQLSGYGMRSDLVAVRTDREVVQIVVAQRLPDDLRRFLTAHGPRPAA